MVLHSSSKKFSPQELGSSVPSSQSSNESHTQDAGIHFPPSQRNLSGEHVRPAVKLKKKKGHRFKAFPSFFCTCYTNQQLIDEIGLTAEQRVLITVISTVVVAIT